MLYLVSNGGVPAFSDGVGVINGFGSGNRVVFDSLVYGSGVYGSGISASLTSVRYQAIGNGLGTLTLSSGLNVAGTLMVAGDYNGKAFQIAPEFPGGASILTVAPSGPPRGDAFLFTDAAGVSGAVAGEAYAGPVAGLDRQYIWPGTGGVALAATVGNVFLHGGVGDDALQVKGGFNVLDGGAGSNFLVGGTGGGWRGGHLLCGRARRGAGLEHGGELPPGGCGDGVRICCGRQHSALVGGGGCAGVCGCDDPLGAGRGGDGGERVADVYGGQPGGCADAALGHDGDYGGHAVSECCLWLTTGLPKRVTGSWQTRPDCPWTVSAGPVGYRSRLLATVFGAGRGRPGSKLGADLVEPDADGLEACVHLPQQGPHHAEV